MIYAYRPDAGSRVIGGYMIFYSAGSAAGALASTAVYSVAGWGAVCLLGAAFSLLALAVWALSARRSRLATRRCSRNPGSEGMAIRQ